MIGSLCRRALVIAAIGSFSAGCSYTVASDKLQPVRPKVPAVKPRIEHSVGDFGYTLVGGKMVTSNYAGRRLTEKITEAWKERGYIAEAAYVDASKFSGNADYNVTLSGSQYGDSSIGLQILSGLTLMVLPYTVTQQYDIHYTLLDVKTGERFYASVEDSMEVYVQLFLLFALSVADRGFNQTTANMGDHLYDQLARAGAFRRFEAATPPAH